MLSKILVVLLKGYQWAISPLFGANCRFYPTCSQYAIEAVQEYGPFSGSWLSLKRLFKCHPYHPGGYDPLPGEQITEHHTENS